MKDTPQPIWKFQLLGDLRAECGTKTLDKFQTQRTAMLLAYLAYAPQRKHSREELIDLLWPDAPLDAGRKRLSQAVFWLRTQLEFEDGMQGTILLADRQNVGLNLSGITVDTVEFLAASGRASDDQAAAVLRLEEAATLYQGELLPGYYDDWVITERGRLHAHYLMLLQQLAQHYERSQNWERALDYARRALASDPLAEELNCDLMRLLSASGQSEAALRQFREMERLLEKELGEAPSPPARALMEQIRQEKQISLAQKLENPKPPTLLRPLTRFFGRDREIALLKASLTEENVRLLTLTGTSGTGKTRLALETAVQLTEYYQGAVWFVSLAEISDPFHIAGMIGEVLRLTPSETDSPLEQITKALAQRPTLLVLDNAEHLIEGTGQIVRSLLERVSSLRILVTSQQRLGLSGEREMPLLPLALPEWSASSTAQNSLVDQLMQAESVRLFVDRAQSVRPAFAVTPQNAQAIADLCASLEGSPLAIELCASWAQSLTPAQMLTQLTRRFDLLVSRRSDIPARHRSLLAALEYSYLLLPPNLRQFFIQLAVFRGGWTLEAAEAVCIHTDAPISIPTPQAVCLSTLTELTEMCERSLIVAEEKSAEGTDSGMRYRMLEALREFATKQHTMAIIAPLRRRHAEYFLHLAEAAELQLSGAEQAIWIKRLEAEHDNLRAALSWAMEIPGDLEAPRLDIGLRLASALAMFWEAGGYLAEGQRLMSRLLALPDSNEQNFQPLTLRAKALNALAYLARARADFQTSERSAKSALEIGRAYNDSTIIATALYILGSLAIYREDHETAHPLLAEAEQITRSTGRSYLLGRILLSLGLIAINQRDWSLARALCSESYALWKAKGDQIMVTVSRNNLGLVARYQGDLDTALNHFAENLEYYRKLSNRAMLALTLLNIGTVYRLLERYSESWRALEEASTLAVANDSNREMAWCIKELGHLACAQNQWHLGTNLLSASESLRQTLGISFSPADPAELSRDTSRAKSKLGEALFQNEWEAGSRWETSRAFAEASRLHTPGPILSFENPPPKKVSTTYQI